MASQVAVSVTAAICRALEDEAILVEIENPAAARALHRTATWLAVSVVNERALPDTIYASILETLGQGAAPPVALVADPEMEERVRRGGF